MHTTVSQIKALLARSMRVAWRARVALARFIALALACSLSWPDLGGWARLALGTATLHSTLLVGEALWESWRRGPT